MRIEGLKKYPKTRRGGDYFSDLPFAIAKVARLWLWKWMQRWKGNLPEWRFAILIGQAKRLARNPPTSAWGRMMKAKRGGYAVQRKYRQEGRHPTAAATDARKWKRINPAMIVYLPLWCKQENEL